MVGTVRRLKGTMRDVARRARLLEPLLGLLAQEPQQHVIHITLGHTA